MPHTTDFYGYLPNRTAALFGIVYFGSACMIFVLQTVFGRFKHYWMLVLAVAAMGETIGWAARLWAHSSPQDWMPYMIQLCSLIITPVFISAADYVLFCRIIEKLGTRLFSIPNSWYWAGFVAFDMVSLAIQTVGGVEVSSAQDTQAASHGGNIMRAGIIFQFSNTAVFAVLLLVTQYRLRGGHQSFSRAAGWPAILAMWISTLLLLLRNGYRILELSDGWNGHIMRTEVYLIGLDLVPMAVAIGGFLVFSPSLFLSPSKQKEELQSVERNA